MANNSVPYGFVGIQDLYSQRVQQAGPERIWDAIAASLAEYNRVANAIVGVWSQPTTVAMEQVELPGSGTLQPLDEWGNPLPVQPSGYYQVAYPIQGGGTAFGDNRVTRAIMTVEEVARLTMDAMQRDKDWLIRHALAALFTNTTWTYTDKVGPNGSKGLGSITIQPLANSDSVTYARKGALSASTDTHYLAQASAVADATNPFPTIKAELDEHPSNSGPVVAYIPSDMVSSVAALTEFVEVTDPDIRYGANSDVLAANGEAMVGPGKEVIGKTKSGVWVVDTPIMPSTYILAISTGGGAPLRMREYPAPELQGFFLEQHSPDGNRQESRFIRYAGFGVRNRVSALVMRTGNGSYAIPSGYTAPLAV
jgi:hypothetical protein